MATLFLVSTPIGNLEDITLRAIRVLSLVEIIACEDTRKTGFLLKSLPSSEQSNQNQRVKLISFFEGNEEKRIPELIRLLKEGKNIALVSSAGTPLISDPGFKLVRESLAQGIKVESIPGACAALAALTSSGLPTDKFLFLGYLPKKAGKRKKLLENSFLLSQETKVTIIIYLSPHRLIKELETVKEIFTDPEIVLCRELTKIHEETRREKISQAINHFEKTKVQGEFVLLLRRTF